MGGKKLINFELFNLLCEGIKKTIAKLLRFTCWPLANTKRARRSLSEASCTIRILAPPAQHYIITSSLVAPTINLIQLLKGRS